MTKIGPMTHQERGRGLFWTAKPLLPCSLGGYKSMSKPWDNSFILIQFSIHLHSEIPHSEIHDPLAKTSILKKESKVQIHRRRRSAKQQEGSNLETRVYSFLSFCSFLSLCLLRFYFNHVC